MIIITVRGASPPLIALKGKVNVTKMRVSEGTYVERVVDGGGVKHVGGSEIFSGSPAGRRARSARARSRRGSLRSVLVFKRGGVLLTEILLPRVARQGAVCLI